MYETLADKLKITFGELKLYQRAFTHKSFLNEHEDNELRDNERLEFLGDAVLELVTTDYLFHNYPDRQEGELTAWRSALVKGKNLAIVARELELGQYLKLSKGEEASGGRDKDYLLANVTEALIGAIYLDQGYEAAKKVINQFVVSKLDDLIAAGAHQDAKSELQELAQAHFVITPHYEELAAEGPDHDKRFTMAAMIETRQLGSGTGSSKQEAEQNAAAEAIQLLQKETVNNDSEQDAVN